jgi:hypothetical protein
MICAPKPQGPLRETLRRTAGLLSLNGHPAENKKQRSVKAMSVWI